MPLSYYPGTLRRSRVHEQLDPPLPKCGDPPVTYWMTCQFELFVAEAAVCTLARFGRTEGTTSTANGAHEKTAADTAASTSRMPSNTPRCITPQTVVEPQPRRQDREETVQQCAHA